MRSRDKEIPVRSSNLFSFRRVLAFVLLFCASAAAPASAQTGGSAAPQTPQRPVAVPNARVPAPAAHKSETACGGFIEQQSPTGQPQIVGAEQERERHVFGQGDLVFIDAGSQQGLRVGQEFEVARPRGQFRSKFSHKGTLGVYVQEVGQVRVVRVRERVSVAEVTLSCDNLLVGDILRPLPAQQVLAARADVNLDRFAEPTGKQTGHIVLARDDDEMLSRDQVVFIDLGAEDNVRVGDYLTVFRPEGRGTIVKSHGEVASNSRRGFESDEFRGGGFSNESRRVKNVNGDMTGASVKTESIQRQRPPVPRLVIGEVVVLHVEGRTATAVVTRVAQEIHTGDSVEVQ
jgi:hypothetical protein